MELPLAIFAKNFNLLTDKTQRSNIIWRKWNLSSKFARRKGGRGGEFDLTWIIYALWTILWLGSNAENAKNFTSFNYFFYSSISKIFKFFLCFFHSHISAYFQDMQKFAIASSDWIDRLMEELGEPSRWVLQMIREIKTFDLRNNIFSAKKFTYLQRFQTWKNEF